MMLLSFSQFLRPRLCYYRINISALLSYQQSMSQISSKKVSFSWKISDNSRINPSEESIRDLRSTLPQKFSPSKYTPRGSKIFTASKEKLQLVRGDRSMRDVSLTPSKGEGAALLNYLSMKDSVPLPETPQRRRTDRPLPLQPQDSLILQQLESESPVPKLQGIRLGKYQLLKAQQQFHQRTINQIRADFIAFKAQVWAELLQQKETIAKIAAELAIRIEQSQMQRILNTIQVDQQVPKEVLPEVNGEVVKQIRQLEGKIGDFSANLQKKCSDLIMEGLGAGGEILSIPTSKQEDRRTLIAQVEAVGRTPNKIAERINNNRIERVVDRGSTPLDKCNQIAETIGILSEINSSPVNRAKSIERLNIEQFKQKLIQISCSNNQLIKEPMRTLLREQKVKEQEKKGKLKGSFKLDKFYNAIQKLKEEVNQIRNINDMKQIKKLKILKVQQ